MIMIDPRIVARPWVPKQCNCEDTAPKTSLVPLASKAGMLEALVAKKHRRGSTVKRLMELVNLFMCAFLD